MTIELERFIAKRELLDNFTHARVLTLRKSDNLLFEFAFGDELSHCVGNCLLYCTSLFHLRFCSEISAFLDRGS